MPFSPQEFFAVFSRYNTAVWPAQAALLALGLLAAYLAFRPRPWSHRVVAASLAMLWMWMGVVYHLHFFRLINPAALLFGLLFLAQAALLLWRGVVRDRLRFQAPHTWRGVAGAVLIVYAFVVYPLLGRMFGHVYPASPTFGLPCPTTIATLGILLWAAGPVPIGPAVIPVLWSAIGSSAAFRLDVYEDLGLAVAGVLMLIVLAVERRAEETR